ncbi:HAMP domain-containing sensor histidine kinase [Paenibacillus hodogayensis]|uniref:Heme sensor protein HssS n=1 Tax=Paenibacillus hodogayensis TaxID=279208 RepID=A0ABV5VTP6_9BACL
MKSLYASMCLIFCSVIIVSSLLGFLVSNLYYQVRIKPQNDAKLTGMAHQIQTFLEAHPDSWESYLTSTAALGYRIYITDESGREHIYGTPFRVMDLEPPHIRTVLDGQVYHGVAEFPSKPFITGFFDNQLRNSVGVPVRMQERNYALFLRPDAQIQFGELRIFFSLILGLAILFSLGFVVIGALYIVRPINRLAEATKRISEGRYDIRLNVGRRDQIGQLASRFMTMSRELERTNRARQEFVANVSHEIESPLTSIQGFANALKDPSLPERMRLEYLSIIDGESRRLSLLSKQLLTLSSLDYDPEALQSDTFDLRVQLRQAVQSFEWRLTEKQLAVRLNLEPITIRGDSNLLYQVWLNLLSNAVKYTAPGGSVSIASRLVGETCTVTVTDTGEGIPAEELPLIFDRFHKVDRARTHESHSSGLGLAIVQKIIKAHNGTIDVKSTVWEGTAFTVTLPLL